MNSVLVGHANPLWGAPRVHGELLNLGIEVAAIDCGQVSATAPKAAQADLANIPDQSCGADRLDRLLYRSDRNIPGSVCLHRAVACSTPRGALQCDGAPEPGDNTANSRSVPLGSGA